jgi:hypothetical protein
VVAVRARVRRGHDVFVAAEERARRSRLAPMPLDVNPSLSPTAPSDAPTVRTPSMRRLAWGRNLLIALSITVHALALIPARHPVTMREPMIEYEHCIGLALLFMLGALALHVAVRRREEAPLDVALEAFCIGLATSAMSTAFLYGVGAVDMLVNGFQRGRQLRVGGKVMLPKVSAVGRAFAGPPALNAPFVAQESAEERAAIAQAWRENGRTEHASVAAFAQLSLDLMALGAPPELLRAANEDALDEIAHTELCFAIAQSFDGLAQGPEAFPEVRSVDARPTERIAALSRLAVDSLFDGALHEGVSARTLASLAKVAGVESIQEALRVIARDEGRHARHAWEVVKWCVEQGGAPVHHALLGALSHIPTTLPYTLPETAREGAWERVGLHGAARLEAAYSATRAYLAEAVAGMRR